MRSIRSCAVDGMSFSIDRIHILDLSVSVSDLYMQDVLDIVWIYGRL